MVSVAMKGYFSENGRISDAIKPLFLRDIRGYLYFEAVRYLGDVNRLCV